MDSLDYCSDIRIMEHAASHAGVISSVKPEVADSCSVSICHAGNMSKTIGRKIYNLTLVRIASKIQLML